MLLIPVRLLLSSPSLQKLTCDEQIAHYPTLLSIPADLAEPILSETDKYKIALRECYASFGAKLVAFEVGRLSGKGGHAHVQVRPFSFSPAAAISRTTRPRR